MSGLTNVLSWLQHQFFPHLFNIQCHVDSFSFSTPFAVHHATEKTQYNLLSWLTTNSGFIYLKN